MTFKNTHECGIIIVILGVGEESLLSEQTYGLYANLFYQLLLFIMIMGGQLAA